MTRLEIVMKLLAHPSAEETPNQAAVDYAFDIAEYILKSEREAVAANVPSEQAVNARLKELHDAKERRRAEAFVKFSNVTYEADDKGGG